MRQLITAQLGITMACLPRFIDANQPGKDTLVPQKQEVKLDENLSKVQAPWQFNQFTKSLRGRLSKLVCDWDNTEQILLSFPASRYQADKVCSDDIMMTLCTAHAPFPVMSVIVPSVWCVACNILL